MAKFRSLESRDYPTLSLTLVADDVVDLPDDTDVAYLVKVVETKTAKADSAPAVVTVDETTATTA